MQTSSLSARRGAEINAAKLPGQVKKVRARGVVCFLGSERWATRPRSNFRDSCPTARSLFL